MKLDAKVIFPDLLITFNGKKTDDAAKIALSRTAQQAINVILKKTKSGVDADDNPFKPYSKKVQAMATMVGESAEANL